MMDAMSPEAGSEGRAPLRRIGIFGGTFDPPHCGHLAVASAALTHGGVDEVWLMVSPCNPFKHGRRISPVADRLAMTRLAVGSLPQALREHMHVSDFETRMPTPSYTIDTLRALAAEYPGCSFRLIVGGDNLTAFRRWKSPDEIIRDFGLIVYPRPGDEADGCDKMPPGCVILRGVALKGENSTAIRRALARGAVPCGVPAQVARYINDKGLYNDYTD